MKRILMTFLLATGLMFAALPAFAQPVQIGYTNCAAVSNYSQSLITELGQFRWFFAHASVGANMMEGIASFRSMSSIRYPFYSVSEDGVPPASTQNGAIYEYARGNPSWDEKFDSFGAYVSNGWRYPKIHLALNKLCYIDQDANLDYCIRAMTNLETAFPETMFVYMTMPLTTSADTDNLKRNIFNDGLRDWTRTNNRVLFDVADIEAHDANGALCLSTISGRVCQRLCDAYSTDGGHLNAEGSKRVASGFYALAAALLTVDRDQDGMSDGRELIAGMRPVDGASVFKVKALKIENGRVQLRWLSATNRLYTLSRGSDLAAPSSFTNILSNIVATPPANSCTDSPVGIGPFFYRVNVKQ